VSAAVDACGDLFASGGTDAASSGWAPTPSAPVASPQADLAPGAAASAEPAAASAAVDASVNSGSPWSAAVATSLQPAAGLTTPSTAVNDLVDGPAETAPSAESAQPASGLEGVATPESSGDAGLSFQGDIRL
jgi:hypothetical protein